LELESCESTSRNSFLRTFFSHRYDYRAEWLRFVETVSEPGASNDKLSVRVIKALAQIIDSPGGILWRINDKDNYSPEAGWNSWIHSQQKISIHDPFISGFRHGERIQVQHTPVETGATDFHGRGWLFHSLQQTHHCFRDAFVCK